MGLYNFNKCPEIKSTELQETIGKTTYILIYLASLNVYPFTGLHYGRRT